MVALVLPLQIHKECFYHVLISICEQQLLYKAGLVTLFSHEAIVLNLLQAQVVLWRGKLLMS